MSEVEKIISATAPLSFGLSQAIEEKFKTRIYEIYGFTEAGSVATRRTTESETWLLLNDYKLTSEGTDHSFEITIPGNPDSVLVPDIIRLENDGTFTLIGRAEDIIKVGGKRISLQELNFHLKKAPGVIDGVIFQHKNGQDNTRRLVSVLKMESEVSTGEVIRHLRLRVDPVFIPKTFVQVDSLPRDANGKIPREKLVSLLEQEMSENN
jgi:acyl-coenzyme A synthetase/AMP-(fatty) acid ligase